jgi:hypothetical protein
MIGMFLSATAHGGTVRLETDEAVTVPPSPIPVNPGDVVELTPHGHHRPKPSKVSWSIVSVRLRAFHG